MQCILCLRSKCDIKKSFHCSPECLHDAWPFHVDFHAQAIARSEAANNGNGNNNGNDANGLHASNSNASLFGGHQTHHHHGRTQYNYAHQGETWVEVSRERNYTPIADDVGAVLKFECNTYDAASPYMDIGKTFGVMTHRVMPSPVPPRRAMIPLIPPVEKLKAAGKSIVAKAKFTLLSYNVLADLYASAEQFPNCPTYALAWTYRRVNLLKELLAYDADIMCLQEVQSNHYQDFLLPELTKAGYTSVFKKKTAEVYTRSAYAIDGCATFFKRSKFALVKKYEVEFNKAAMSLADVFPPEQKKTALNRLMKDNVALIAVLELLEPTSSSAASMPTGGGDGGKSNSGTPTAASATPGGGDTAATSTGNGGSSRRQLICVANTHIHSNPELNEVKIWQVHTLLKGLEKIAHSADIPMLVAGDFNATPASAAHELLVKGVVNPVHPDLNIDPLGILRPPSKLQHSLPLSSAYAAISLAPPTPPDTADGEGHAMQRQLRRLHEPTGEPQFTNYTSTFKDTLDYILYSSDSLVPVATLELPDVSEARGREVEGLPNEQWPSDHVALMAEFAYLTTSNGQEEK
jgi:CCR4-NOT transcription complex subunit 6